MDVDDNPPRFARQTDDAPQLLEIDEEVPEGIAIGLIRAIDPDQGENAAINYTIIDGNELGLFTIERAPNNTGIIRSMSRLDREARSQHLLTVRCFKAGTRTPLRKSYNRLDPAEIQVLVKLRDIDDHAPEFTSGSNTTIGARARTQAGVLVMRIEALDADSEAGPLEYRISGGRFERKGIDLPETDNINATDVFRLDSATGELRTSRALSSFADGNFYLELEASSSGRATNANLSIHVARDRDLLGWELARPPADARRELPSLERAALKALDPKGNYDLLIYDARFSAKHDGSLDFGSTTACFRLVRNGEVLPRDEALDMLQHLQEELREVYNSARVTSVGRCSGGEERVSSAATPAQAWLLAVALLVGVAGLISCFVLCVMHCSYRRRARKHLLLQEAARQPPPHLPLYPEPLYST